MLRLDWKEAASITRAATASFGRRSLSTWSTRSTGSPTRALSTEATCPTTLWQAVAPRSAFGAGEDGLHASGGALPNSVRMARVARVERRRGLPPRQLISCIAHVQTIEPMFTLFWRARTNWWRRNDLLRCICSGITSECGPVAAHLGLQPGATTTILWKERAAN